MMGFLYTCISPLYEESLSIEKKNRAIRDIPEYFAIQKALSLSELNPSHLIISFDTVVFYQDRILGKPKSPEDALHMLCLLNGNSHEVITGIALASNNKIISSGKETTLVNFAEIEAKILKKYACSKEPMDKAGSYAIQGKGAIFINKIEGCYYNVMGVPIQRTLRLLRPFLK